MLAPQCPQQPQLVTLQAMDARRAVLGAADIDGRAIQVNLLPAKINELAHPQCVAEGHQDQQPIAAKVAAFTRGGHQLVDLGFGQVFALPVISVFGPTTTNCRLFRS
jgi:hypothetical protein